MRRRIRPLAVIAISAAVGLVSIASRGIEPPGWNNDANAADAARVKWRLSRVELELSGKDLTGLSSAQSANRAEDIRLLHRYWTTGRFPHNHDFPGRRVPYFVDRHGVPSELAYLMIKSGRQDLVDRVATISNNATVFDMVNDPNLGPALVGWLNQNGLTVDEAALMQSFYSGS
jgi:hypothetical protein